MAGRNRFGRWLLPLLGLALIPAPRTLFADSGKQVAPVASSGPLADQVVYRNSYALIVGINQYENLPETNWLSYAVKDATDLRDLLIKSYGFPAGNIKVLTDSQATKENIENALADLADQSKIGPDDRVLVFFSGHGQTIPTAQGGDQGFLIPYDANVDLEHITNPGPFLRTCVQMDTVWTYLDSSPAKHSLILADACYSGLLAKARSLEDVKPEVLAQMASLRAMQVMTAGTKGQPCEELAKFGHGAFTYKLLEHLTADATKPGLVITATDLYAEISQPVRDLTNGAQFPQLASHSGAEGDFMFITTAPRPVPPLSLPAPSNVTPAPTRSSPPAASAVARIAAAASIKAGLASIDTGNLDAAIASFTAAIQAVPSDASALYDRGVVYGKKSDWDDAIADYTAAISYEPDNVNAYFNRSNSYRRKGKYDEALDDINEYLKTVTTDPDAYLERGLSEDGKEDFASGEADYSKAISLKSDDANAYFDRGLDERHDNKLDKAIIDLGIYIGFVSDDPDGYFWRGRCYSDTQQWDKAALDYTKALGYNPDYPGASAHRARAYYNLTNYERALADYGAAIALAPDDASEYYNRGLVESDQKNYDDAIADYTKYISLQPGDPDGYYRRGLALGDELQFDRAIADYRKAVELKPDPGREGTLGWCQFRAGLIKEAIATDVDALGQDGSQTWIRFDLGLAYAVAGNRADADSTYALALKTATRSEIESAVSDIRSAEAKADSALLKTELARLQAANPAS